MGSPRVCGEKNRYDYKGIVRKGSPRVCGEKVKDRFILMTLLGSPRVCGEKEYAEDDFGVQVGSPPRVREKTKKIPNISRFYPGAACFSFSFS